MEVIERDGWHQGSLFEGKPTDKKAAAHSPVCALGSVYRALYGSCDNESINSQLHKRGVFHAAYDRLMDTCLEIHGVTIPTFNDDPSTSKEDVLLLMKKAVTNTA